MSLSLRAADPARLQTHAQREEVYATDALAQLIEQWAPALAAEGPLPPSPRRRPGHRADRVLYNTTLHAGALATIDDLAADIAEGDRSRAVRAVLDRAFAAPGS